MSQGGGFYTYDDLPEGFPIRMGPGVDLFKPLQIDGSGMIVQHGGRMPKTTKMHGEEEATQ